ncbi:MAG: hypothetical protein ABFR62_14030 [Bacteroidota bacterium]
MGKTIGCYFSSKTQMFSVNTSGSNGDASGSNRNASGSNGDESGSNRKVTGRNG